MHALPSQSISTTNASQSQQLERSTGVHNLLLPTASAHSTAHETRRRHIFAAEFSTTALAECSITADITACTDDAWPKLVTTVNTALLDLNHTPCPVGQACMASRAPLTGICRDTLHPGRSLPVISPRPRSAAARPGHHNLDAAYNPHGLHHISPSPTAQQHTQSRVCIELQACYGSRVQHSPILSDVSCTAEKSAPCSEALVGTAVQSQHTFTT